MADPANKVAFKIYMEEVNDHLDKMASVQSLDIADFSYMDKFIDEVPALETAYEALCNDDGIAMIRDIIDEYYYKHTPLE
jgi:hypothetical protein